MNRKTVFWVLGGLFLLALFVIQFIPTPPG